jgi:hypothetical protein
MLHSTLRRRVFFTYHYSDYASASLCVNAHYRRRDIDDDIRAERYLRQIHGAWNAMRKPVGRVEQSHTQQQPTLNEDSGSAPTPKAGKTFDSRDISDKKTLESLER